MHTQTASWAQGVASTSGAEVMPLIMATDQPDNGAVVRSTAAVARDLTDPQVRADIIALAKDIQVNRYNCCVHLFVLPLFLLQVNRYCKH